MIQTNENNTRKYLPEQLCACLNRSGYMKDDSVDYFFAICDDCSKIVPPANNQENNTSKGGEAEQNHFIHNGPFFIDQIRHYFKQIERKELMVSKLTEVMNTVAKEWARLANLSTPAPVQEQAKGEVDSLANHQIEIYISELRSSLKSRDAEIERLKAQLKEVRIQRNDYHLWIIKLERKLNNLRAFSEDQKRLITELKNKEGGK